MPLPRWIRFAPLILPWGLVVYSPQADAEWKVTLTPVPVALSGTLDPLLIAVDGRPVLQRKESFTRLTANGRELPGAAGAHHPYFQSVTGDSLEITLGRKEGGDERLDVIRLPTAAVDIDEDHWVLRVPKGISSAAWDGTIYQITDGTALVPGPITGVSHVLEVGDGRCVRTYAVAAEAVAVEPPPPDRTTVGVGISVDGWQYRQLLHFYFSRQYGSRWSWHGGIEWGIPYFNYLTRLGVAAMGGYQLWRGEKQVFVELGLSFRAIFISRELGAIDASQFNTSHPDVPSQSGILLGPYLRIEPLHLGRFRFGLSLETDAFLQLLRSGGTNLFAVVTYEW